MRGLLETGAEALTSCKQQGRTPILVRRAVKMLKASEALIPKPKPPGICDPLKRNEEVKDIQWAGFRIESLGFRV